MSTFKSWMWIIAAVICILVLYYILPVLAPFIVAAVIAYIFDPLVTYLHDYHIPRLLGTLIIFVICIGIIVLLCMWFLPRIEQEALILVHRIPAMLHWVHETFFPWLTKHFGTTFSASLENEKQISIFTHVQQGGDVMKIFGRFLFHSGYTLFQLLFNVVVIIVVSFYLLRDWEHAKRNMKGLFPPRMQGKASALTHECYMRLMGFIRGQLLVMLGLAIVYSVGLWIVGLDLAMLIGVMAGLVSAVPYLGFFIGLFSALIAAAFQFHDGIHLLYVFIVFVIGEGCESMLFTPLLVGDRIGLHPVAVIFAILVGGYAFGFIGVLVALPVVTVLMVIVRHLVDCYKSSWIYTQ